MKRFIVTGIVLGVSLLAGPAWAAGYAGFKGGFYFPEESGALDTGYSLRLAAAMSLAALGGQQAASPDANRIFLEGAIGYYTAELDGPVNGDLDVIPVTASLIIQQPLANAPLTLQAGAGLGLYFAEIDVDAPGWRNDSDIELGLHLTAGMAFDLSKTLALTGDLDWDIVTDDVGGLFLHFGLQKRF